DRGEIAGAVSMTSVSGKVETVYVGLADPKTGRPFDAHSMFWIASMTKGFTGAAVMSCVDRGLVALDDTIEKYIPEMAKVKVAEKGSDGAVHLRPPKVKMTLRMCLSHQAGFPFNSPIAEARGGRTMTLAEHATAAAACPLLWDPLTGHKYSNVDINLAGRVVEIVTGVRFEDYLQRTFFDPLGMKEITFFPTPEQVARKVFVACVAKGRHYADGTNDHWARMWRDEEIARTKTGLPSGGLYATAAEVMKIYQMLANDGCAPDGTRLLSHKSILELSTAQYPQSDCYSLGLRQYGDWFGHDGALQTEAYANWKENKVCLLYVQLTGEWRHPFKSVWRQAMQLPRK
ncbi:MAG: beta-lactamase family protein, partial [Kiritimatiellae bacterium]|nr:beta-lactamase family protein [Kiritimatiellia bacterium]